MKTPFGHHSKLTEHLKQERIRKAGPILLEALEELMNCSSMREGEDVRIFSHKQHIDKARAAIAAAKGQ